MFRKNDSYKQYNLFGIDQRLTNKQLKMWKKSREHKFFKHIFAKIDEKLFSVLYSDKKSRPNVPVNQLVGSLILKHLYDWTYEELFTHLSFNMLSRHAIGINDWSEDIFAEASLYNFQNKVTAHYLKTGQDLFMEVFDGLTTNQLIEFGIATNIQRGDSFLMGSNIIDYTRLNLLLEVLIRLYRILSKTDKDRLGSLLSEYTKQPAGQYIYRLNKEDFPKEIAQLGKIYHRLHTELKTDYRDHRVFRIFERVYTEQFVIANQKIEVVPPTALHSGILMSPDDDQATYRKKGKVESKGYVGHISETANPDNELNLITDLAVKPNNTDDAKILEERLPEMIKKTPQLDEYHADGLYGNQVIDKQMEKHNIKQIQSTIRGRKSGGGIKVQKQENGQLTVNCKGGQTVKAVKRKTAWRAEFDYAICKQCPFKDRCTSKVTGTKRNAHKRYLTISEKTVLTHTRFNNINKLPEERKKIRANVEATIKEAKRGIKNGKLRVRGLLKAKYYLIWTSIGINLGRIHRFLISEMYLFIDNLLSCTLVRMLR